MIGEGRRGEGGFRDFGVFWIDLIRFDSIERRGGNGYEVR